MLFGPCFQGRFHPERGRRSCAISFDTKTEARLRFSVEFLWGIERCGGDRSGARD